MPYLFPYLESNDVYDEFNFSTGANTIPWNTDANAGVTSTRPNPPTSRVVAAFLCPTDIGVRTMDIGTYRFATNNFLAIFQGVRLGNCFSDAPSIRTCLGRNYGARHGDITDGASKSMILAEYVRSLGASNDHRGLLWGDIVGYGFIFTAATPNSTTPDTLFQTYCVNSTFAVFESVCRRERQHHRRHRSLWRAAVPSRRV